MTPAPAINIDDYIARLPADVAKIMGEIRDMVRTLAPEATETIAYGMPTFRLGKTLIHVAAFKGHIGIFPPVRDPGLAPRLAPYRGDKGNLRFPLEQPLPLDLIADIVRARIALISARQ